MADNIKAPSHYVDGRKYEPKDVIRDWGLNFNLGSAVKYISRAGRKGDKLEDLQKAKQFLEFEIEAVKEKDSREEEEKRFSAELLSRAVTRSENTMRFEDVPESLKPRVINNIAQEVLDSQIIPPDEVREAVIDRIVEKINNDELDCFDISTDLYCGYQDIRDAIARQALRKERNRNPKSDIGMTCKEAAEIGDAMAKGFEEGIQQKDNDLSLTDIINMVMEHNDIPEPDVINLHFKFEDDPIAIPANTVSIKFHTNRKEI